MDRVRPRIRTGPVFGFTLIVASAAGWLTTEGAEVSNAAAFASTTATTTGPDWQLPNGLVWGEITNGLHMAVEVDSPVGIVQCWLRNATTVRQTYSNWGFGTLGSASLEVHSANGWRRIELAPIDVAQDMRLNESGTGPTEFDLRSLEPGEIVGTTNGLGGLSPRRFRLGPGETIGGITIIERIMLSYLPKIHPRRVSTLVDLLDFAWNPEQLGQSVLELRVVQTFVSVRNSSQYGHGDWRYETVTSSTVTGDGTAIRSLLEKLAGN